MSGILSVILSIINVMHAGCDSKCKEPDISCTEHTTAVGNVYTHRQVVQPLLITCIYSLSLG